MDEREVPSTTPQPGDRDASEPAGSEPSQAETVPSQPAREPSELAPEGWDAEVRAGIGPGGPELGWVVAVGGAVLAAVGIAIRIVQRQRERSG